MSQSSSRVSLAELSEDHEFLGEWLYYIEIYVRPSATGPWGWKLEGHHAIINYFVLGDQVVATPLFIGSEPVKAPSGKYKGLEILQEHQNGGLQMIGAISEPQRKQAILSFSKTGNSNLSEAFKDNVVIDYAGLRTNDLAGPARQKLQLDLPGGIEIALQAQLVLARFLIQPGIFERDGNERSQRHQHAFVLTVKSPQCCALQIQHANEAVLNQQRHHQL